MPWGYCEEHWGTLLSQFIYRHIPASCQAVGSTPHQSPAVAGAASVPALSSSQCLTGNARTDGWGVLGHHGPRSRRRVKVSALRSCACCWLLASLGAVSLCPAVSLGSAIRPAHSNPQTSAKLCPCSHRSFHKDHPTGSEWHE